MRRYARYDGVVSSRFGDAAARRSIRTFGRGWFNSADFRKPLRKSGIVFYAVENVNLGQFPRKLITVTLAQTTRDNKQFAAACGFILRHIENHVYGIRLCAFYKAAGVNDNDFRLRHRSRYRTRVT